MGHIPAIEGTALMSTRPIIGFFVRFLMFFAVLMILWSGVGAMYCGAFRGMGNLLFARFGTDGLVRFQRSLGSNTEDDIEVILMNRGNGAESTFAGSSRLQGYKPTAFLLALILATPVSWKRRGRAAQAAFEAVLPLRIQACATACQRRADHQHDQKPPVACRGLHV